MPRQAQGGHQLLLGTLRCAIRTKTVAAQDGPARRRLERHRIVLAALIARDVESLTLTCLSSSSTKVRPSCITTWLTSFRMSQITFPVILLFAFSKCEGSVALRTRDFEVWHRGFSTRVDSRLTTLFCSSERWRRVSFIHEVMVRKRCFSNTTPKSYASRRVNCRECTPAINSIQLLYVAESRQGIPDVWRKRNTTLVRRVVYFTCFAAHWLLTCLPQAGIT
jgi:hypothetical protein